MGCIAVPFSRVKLLVGNVRPIPAPVTLISTVNVAEPLLFVAVTVWFCELVYNSGVPSKHPVVELKFNPNGKFGDDAIDHEATIPPAVVSGHTLAVTSLGR